MFQYVYILYLNQCSGSLVQTLDIADIRCQNVTMFLWRSVLHCETYLLFSVSCVSHAIPSLFPCVMQFDHNDDVTGWFLNEIGQNVK